MKIKPSDNAENALQNIGYYRLKGYCFHLFDRNTGKFEKDTDFSNIIDLYNFDTELSHLVFGYISEIEVTLRARTVNALLIYNDALILNDPSVFDNKALYWKNQSTVATEIARSDDVFIKHNFRNHDGAIPLWAVVEVMSFGTLSKIIKTMKTGTHSAFSVLTDMYKFDGTNGRKIKPSKKLFTSWIQSVCIMRNICAHNSRLYNRALSTTPELINSDKITPVPKFSGLYQILLSMKYLRPSDKSWIDFTEKLNALFNKYSHVIEYKRLNFPSDWETHIKIEE